jgi:hypothetical protein
VRTKRSLVWVVSGVTALGLVGGCAARQVRQLEPKLELRAAAQGLAGEQRGGFTFSLTGSADDLVAGLTPSADEADTLRKLFDSSITVAYDRAGDGVADDRMLAAVTIDGVQGTEVRLVDGTLYAKAPVTDLAAKLDLGDIAAARSAAGAAVPGLDAAFDGKWVSLAVQDAAELSTDLPSSATDAGKAVAELEASASNLFDGADITRDPADAKHLIVTTSTAKAYAEVKRLATAMSDDLGKELAGEVGDQPEDRPVVLDVWADNGDLSAIELNLLQFVDGAAGRVALRAEVTAGVPIEAPSGATKIDTSALAGLAGSGMYTTTKTMPITYAS